MKTLLKIGLTVFAIFALALAGILGWFFFYTGDLPDVGQLAQFTPDSPAVVYGPCLLKSSTVVPLSQIGKELRDATGAAETEKMRYFQVARFVLCGQKRRSNLKYALDQYRLIPHVRWQFSKDQIFTIYMNEVYFGDDMLGVEDASRHFFGKEASSLSVAQAALLAGMIRAGDALSPFKHSDRALQRRSQVIEAMRLQGKLSAEEAAEAELEPLGVLSIPTR
jgi:membrane carboxypeptidase/penicillin-binding protein